ncbi:MAG TPA: response regulator transcription factor [Candidatus Micrarchaeia archaeon]|nr:response regulator transcription factor [Candidatus Micrarchaeia archaeon]
MRILIVEDDLRLAGVLRRGLAEEGCGVDVVRTGEEAVAAATTTPFDVLTLDVMLPGPRDGFQLCAELRRRRVGTPVLMLTARDAVEDRVRGLEAGADDYLPKPFAFVELLARIRALARRHLADRAAVLATGRLRLDTAARELQVAGRAVRLTGKELAILEYLMLHPRQVLTRTQFEEHVWTYDFEGQSNLVDVYMGRLRRKLEAAGGGRPITTLRGLGYRFDPEAPCASD